MASYYKGVGFLICLNNKTGGTYAIPLHTPSIPLGLLSVRCRQLFVHAVAWLLLISLS